MANLNENRIDATLSNQAYEQIMDHFNAINELMPFLTGLTTKERMGLPKISQSNRVFVDNTLTVVADNEAFFPGYINIDQLHKDMDLFHKLDEISIAIKQLQSKVNDTRILAGSEVYKVCLAIYKFVQYAYKSGLGGAHALYQKLKPRFESQGTSSHPSKPEATPERDSGGNALD